MRGKRLGVAAAAFFVVLASFSSPAFAQAPAAELSYAFHFQSEPAPRLTVESRFRGGPQGFTVLGWCLSPWPDAPDCGQAVNQVTVRAERTGKLLPLEHPEPRIWTCDHAPNEPLVVQYELASPRDARAATALIPAVSSEYVLFLGDTALLVPEHLVRPSPTAIHYAWEGPLPAGWTAATSFAVTQREKTVHLPVKAFLQSLFFWGPVRLQDTPVPRQPALRVAWLRTAPPRGEREAILSRLVSIRESVARYLAGEIDRGVTWFVFPSAPGHVSALTLTGSILLLADDGAITDAGPGTARWALTAAHEVVHTGPAGKIQLADGPVPANFLAEALAEFIARRALYRAGLLAARDWAEVISDKLAAQSQASALAGSRPAVPDPYITGDLVMVLLDSEIQRVSAGKADILRLVQELLRQSRRASPQGGGDGRIAWRDFRDLLALLTSASFADEVDGLLREQREVRFSADRFAGCLRLQESPVWAFDPGFDVERSIQEKRVSGVKPEGAAAQAGLQDGETLLEWSVRWNRSDVPVRFLVGGGGEPRAVTYLPRGTILDSRQELVPEPESKRCGNIL